MIRSATLSMVMILMPALLFAQMKQDRNRTGSAYSSIAFGEPVEIFSASGSGLGLRGVSLYDPLSVNSANPALWGVSGQTQGVVSFDMHRIRAEEGDQTGITNRMGVNRFQLVLPVVRTRLGVSAAFLPVTRSSYALNRSSTFTPDFEPIEYLNMESGSGGVNRAELGIGYRISDHFSIGYGMNIYFASLNREHDIEFDSNRYSPVSYNEGISGTGLGHRFGIFSRASGLIRQRDEISFGIAVTLPVEIDVDRSLASYRNLRGSLREVDLMPETGNRSGVIEMPLEFNAGLTYTPSRYVSFSAEYLGQQWSNAAYSLNPVEEQYLVNRRKTGAGVQFHPYRMDGSGGFFSSFKYSAGLTHDTGHLEIGGERVETLMMHTGIGILSQRTASSVDLGFQLGFRGTGAQSLIRETVWGVTLTLNLAEWMFIQPMFQ